MVKRNFRDELQQFEKLITSAKPRAIDTTRKLIAAETERIKKSLVQEVYQFEDERISQRYIKYHQQAIVRLMDLGVPHTRQASAVTDVFSEGLEKLLEFIECHFTRYFDQDAKVPERYLAKMRADIRSRLPTFEKSLEQRNADSELTAIVLKTLHQFASDQTGDHITYRRLIYAKEIQREVIRLLAPKYLSKDINDMLRQLLFYLNYNSGRVLAYYSRYIAEQLAPCETRLERIERLSLLMKNVNQSLVKPEIKYNSMSPSLKSQVAEFLAQEIEYLEKVASLASSNEGRADMFQGFKLKFETSVPQLAYLVKVFLDKKILVNNNVTQILQFMVRYVITRHAETISYSSFRAKFYNVEDGTKKAVRSMLVSMIQHIERD